jgi:hypothetical protein
MVRRGTGEEEKRSGSAAQPCRSLEIPHLKT